MADIREYYLTQMLEARQHYEQQRNLIQEFSVNRLGNEHTKVGSLDNATWVKLEDGPALTNLAPSTSSFEEEDIYKFNETMKSEIQMLTSLRNLHEILVEVKTTTSKANRFRTEHQQSSDDRTTDICSPTNHDPISNSDGRRVLEDQDNENTSMLSNTR